jgi:uncharacterized protein GlcG (DUF336 family)
MSSISLQSAREIIRETLAFGLTSGMKPLSVVVLDAGGHVVAFERADGSSIGRFEIARGKANGAVRMGVGSRALMGRAEQQPYFVAALGPLFDAGIVPVPGGVLLRDQMGTIVGAVGVSGDTSDHDEEAAVAGIRSVNLASDTG